MNSKDYRNIREAYLNVYDEDYTPWDFGPKQKAREKFDQLAQKKAKGNSVPGTATRANTIASVAKDMRTTLDKNSAATGTDPAKQGLQPATQRHTLAALRGAGGGMTASKMYDVKPLKPASRDPRTKNINASYEPDLFDVILEYLITEGYADTQEAALAIMGNMSEDWRESIIVEDIESRREMLKQQRIQQRISSTEAQKRKRFKEQDRETLKKEIIKALIQRQQSSTN